MTQSDILKLCSNSNVFYRGQSIYKAERFTDVEEEFDPETQVVSLYTVADGSYGEEYQVTIDYDLEEDRIIDYECECPAYATYPGMCKHCAALGLYWLDRLSETGPVYEEPKTRTDWEIKNLIQNCVLKEHLEQQKAQGDIELEPELIDQGTDYRGNRKWFLTFKIGNTRKYVLKNLSDFMEHIRQEEVFSYGKQLSFLHSKSAFTEKGWKYVELIGMVDAMYSNSYESLRKELPLNNHTLEAFLMMNLNQEIPYEAYRNRTKSLHILDRDPQWKPKLRSAGEGKGCVLQLPPLDYIEGTKEWFVKNGNQVYRCSDDMKKVLDQIAPLVSTEREISLTIAEEDMAAFCRVVVPLLKPPKILDLGELDLEQYQPEPVEIAFYLDEEGDRITAKVMGKYGEKQNNLLFDRPLNGACYDVLTERRALDIVQAYFPETDRNRGVFYFSSKEEERIYQLLSTGLGQMHEAGKVYATERIKGRKIVTSPRTKVGVAVKGGLLELSLETEGLSRKELLGILDSYRQKKKYYRLKNGDFLSLEDSSAGTMAELLTGLNLKSGELEQEILQVPAFRACYIDKVLQEKREQLQVERSSDYKAIIRNMKNVEDSDYAVPKGLEGILREYQKVGYRWLHTLADLGFGGILADDMGLGKTIQAIAYLLARRQEGDKKTALIVCPASLVYNWAKEFNQFAPELSVAIIAGSVEMRQKLIQEEKERDVWITSYDLLKRDISAYRDLKFGVEVLDEAQNIKNHGTQAAKSVKKIGADIRFALTGTPIENRLSELWSIFDFLMPGILGSYEQFRKTYELPIVHEEQKDVAGRLKKMVSPFILRRLKADVLKELPEKVEQIVYVQMEPEQKRIYMALAYRMKEMLESKSEEDVRTQKLKILAELTRLREVCCDPRLLYEDYQLLSCKVAACMELVKEAVQGEHKVLVFSQFPSVFPILQEWLRAEHLEYYVLTGETSKEKRLELVESFNKDQVPVFLISLKAGGTGLNLTGANIVIHFDPWWNVAAQNQATDRAHRIGQKNPVTVYKLIAQSSIEEKITELQEKKRELADQVLDGEGLSAASLTKEELLEILNG